MTRLVLALWLLLTAAALAAPKVQLSPPQKVGASTVRIAFIQESLEWLGEQQYFVIDGRKVALPPASLGYDRIFSAPNWKVSGGRITGLKYWQFNKEKSTRRAVTLTFPGYKLVNRGPWAFFPGGDTVPDPPK